MLLRGSRDSRTAQWLSTGPTHIAQAGTARQSESGHRSSIAADSPIAVAGNNFQ